MKQFLSVIHHCSSWTWALKYFFKLSFFSVRGFLQIDYSHCSSLTRAFKYLKYSYSFSMCFILRICTIALLLFKQIVCIIYLNTTYQIFLFSSVRGFHSTGPN